MLEPTVWTAELEESIVEWVSEGKPLAAFARQEGMPSTSRISSRRRENPVFDEAVKVAQQDGYEAMASDCLAISDDGSQDTYVTEEGRTVTNHEVVARSKLRVETRFRLLRAWHPTVYGDKQQVEHAGGVVVRVVTGLPSADS